MANKKDAQAQHQFILKNCRKITDRYLEVRNKSQVAREFGISGGGVDSALIASGRPELAGGWLRKQRAPIPRPPTEVKEVAPKEATPKVESSMGGLDLRGLAAELLSKVVGAITNYDKLDGEAKVLRGQVRDLTEENSRLSSRLKKAVEEKERAIKVHNEMVKQSDGKLPTVAEVVAALRREHRPGKAL